MNGNLSPDSSICKPDERVTVLLAEYQAIEQMHMHYDVLNMTMTAIITAGVLALWSLVIQSAFQEHTPIRDTIFVNCISVLAVVVFMVLSVWIRYLTIHRCIVIQKLNRSHEIEEALEMKQNRIFRYNAEMLSAPLDADATKRRPGGHTLELLLYFSLATVGGIMALIFQWGNKDEWSWSNILLMTILAASPFMAILWMSFCKLDALDTINEKVKVGYPWNVLFPPAKWVNRRVRKLINSHIRPL